VELDENARVKRYGRPERLQLDTEEEPQSITAAGKAGDRPVWPDDRPMSGAGFARMDTAVSCVLTRFRVKSPFSLLPFYLAFRKVRHGARHIRGLIQAVFLLEDLRTCYTLSLWKDDWSIVEFGDVHAHIDAANSAHPRHISQGPQARGNLVSPISAMGGQLPQPELGGPRSEGGIRRSVAPPRRNRTNERLWRGVRAVRFDMVLDMRKEAPWRCMQSLRLRRVLQSC
jgi:hypothetical protein